MVSGLYPYQRLRSPQLPVKETISQINAREIWMDNSETLATWCLVWMDNSETLATWCLVWMDNSETLATWCIRHEDKQNKNTTQKTKKMSTTDPNKNREWISVLVWFLAYTYTKATVVLQLSLKHTISGKSNFWCLCFIWDL